MAVKTTLFKYSVGGGQFGLDLTGQFALDLAGQLQLDLGGHIDWIFHLLCFYRFYILLDYARSSCRSVAFVKENYTKLHLATHSGTLLQKEHPILKSQILFALTAPK